MTAPGDPPGPLSGRFVDLEILDRDTRPLITAESGAFSMEPAAAEGGRQAIAATLRLDRVSIPGLPETSLGRELERLTAEVTLVGTLARGPREGALAAWREAGGALVIERLELRWGPMRGAFSGRLTLDEALQPEGRLDARLHRGEAGIAALREAGVLGDETARLIGFALAAYGSLSQAGDGAGIGLPVAIDNRTVTLGPARLLRLPRIRWR